MKETSRYELNISNIIYSKKNKLEKERREFIKRMLDRADSHFKLNMGEFVKQRILEEALSVYNSLGVVPPEAQEKWRERGIIVKKPPQFSKSAKSFYSVYKILKKQYGISDEKFNNFYNFLKSYNEYNKGFHSSMGVLIKQIERWLNEYYLSHRRKRSREKTEEKDLEKE
ncbi:hypothetical protein HRbin34_00545 [bacterium HR34]|nr:hypothetical protein HRbin34_00545 [bacterium HR34]